MKLFIPIKFLLGVDWLLVPNDFNFEAGVATPPFFPLGSPRFLFKPVFTGLSSYTNIKIVLLTNLVIKILTSQT